jgi:hypothetical protein
MKYVIAPVLLLAALALGQTWVVEQIDSTAASGSPVELVKAADGRLWAAYGTGSGASRVACLSESGWVFTDVCSAANLPWTGYRPFLAASPHGEICLACVDSGVGPSLHRMVSDTWRTGPQPYPDSYPLSTVAYDTAGRLYSVLEPWAATFVLAHETDSGWTTSFVVHLPYDMFTWYGDVAYLTAAVDGSPWFLGFSGWGDGYKGYCETDLLHFSGDTWVIAWSASGGWDSNLIPRPAALVPHGDGVGNMTTYQNLMLCDGEPITACPYYNRAAGLAYTSDGLPLAAWVPSGQAAGPFFAYRTNWWHVESIPGPAGIGGIDVETDTIGQVVIVYSTQDSGLWCARGVDVVGAKESFQPRALSRKLEPTVVRSLPAGTMAYDAMGRRVANSRSGVYFVLEEPQASSHNPQSIRKIVLSK